jgi:hypothetical protein
MRSGRVVLTVPFAGALLASSLVASVTSVARADAKRDAVTAEALFDEARKLMTQGDYAAACPKFADSEALDPAPGTALNLAHCYEKAGKWASAWAAYKTAQAVAERAGQRDRAAIASKKVAEVEPTLSRLTISVPASSQASGLEVRVDGDVVAQPAWGVAVPIDGGGHDVSASAPGKLAWKGHVDLKETGQALVVEVPALPDAPQAAGAAPISAPESVAPPGPGEHEGKGQRIGGVVVGGIGVAGVVFGAFAGLHASSKYSDAKQDCGNSTSCSGPTGDAGLALRDSASSWAAVSTVAFAVGGAAIAAGAVIFFTAPHERVGGVTGLAVAPAAQGTGLSVLGRF